MRNNGIISTENILKTQKSNDNLNKAEKKLLLKKYLKNIDEETQFKFWIKTLLSSYNTFPEIINTLDKIIELQASTVSFASDIFNGKNSLENKVEQVIDLSQRKSSLLNVYIMTKQLLKTLSDNEMDFIEKRYLYNWSVEDLAKEYGISLRTAYRKIDKIIDNIYKSSTNRKWTLRFVESQVIGEGWLKERYKKCVSDYFKNSNYQIIEKQIKHACVDKHEEEFKSMQISVS